MSNNIPLPTKTRKKKSTAHADTTRRLPRNDRVTTVPPVRPGNSSRGVFPKAPKFTATPSEASAVWALLHPREAAQRGMFAYIPEGNQPAMRVTSTSNITVTEQVWSGSPGPDGTCGINLRINPYYRTVFETTSSLGATGASTGTHTNQLDTEFTAINYAAAYLRVAAMSVRVTNVTREDATTSRVQLTQGPMSSLTMAQAYDAMRANSRYFAEENLMGNSRTVEFPWIPTIRTDAGFLAAESGVTTVDTDWDWVLPNTSVADFHSTPGTTCCVRSVGSSANKQTFFIEATIAYEIIPVANTLYEVHDLVMDKVMFMRLLEDALELDPPFGDRMWEKQKNGATDALHILNRAQQLLNVFGFALKAYNNPAAALTHLVHHSAELYAGFAAAFGSVGAAQEVLRVLQTLPPESTAVLTKCLDDCKSHDDLICRLQNIEMDEKKITVRRPAIKLHEPKRVRAHGVTTLRSSKRV